MAYAMPSSSLVQVLPVTITVNSTILRQNAQTGANEPAIELTMPNGVRMVRRVRVSKGEFTCHDDGGEHDKLKGSAKVWFETDTSCLLEVED